MTMTARQHFNGGFHDAQQAAERGWEPEWTPGKHPNRDYEAGYWAGRAEFEANGEQLSDNSDKAWNEHQAATEAQA